MPEALPVNVPPEEAIQYFRAKGYQISFAWQEVYAEEHARVFTVAKAMEVDLLEDIRAEVDKAIADGTTLREFRRDLTPTLQRRGWWGKQVVVDSKGGAQVVQLGSPRRLAVIYDTNLRTAHAAGQWQRIQRVKARRPYLRYVSILDDRTRPQHRRWHGTVLPADDPWWDTHYPPNGWRCRCGVQQLSDRDLERYGYEVSSSAPDLGETRPWENPSTGEIRNIPIGIDPGWDYNVGKASLRGITPRELPAAIPPASGVRATDPLPPARPASPDRLLPAGLSEEEYVARFLAEFGATTAKPVVFTDVLGDPLIISDDLFRAANGRYKVTKRRRERSLLLLADTIKEPDEIWAAWETHRESGQALLRRRYLARWLVEGEEPALAVFEYSAKGWRGITAFTPEEVRYLEGQRHGERLWKRSEE